MPPPPTLPLTMGRTAWPVLLPLLLLVGLSLPMPIRVGVNPPASSGTRPVKPTNVLEAYRQYLRQFPDRFESCVSSHAGACHKTDDIDAQIRAFSTYDDGYDAGYLDQLIDYFDAYLVLRESSSDYFGELQDGEDGFATYLETYAM